ncbi:MAG: thioredoxin domain-containing protein [Chloroflexi bacterium]|nr:thioredoxin domain-containing protein [Chloroflexota bacterium]
MRNSSPPRLLIAGCVLLALLLAACGSDGDDYNNGDANKPDSDSSAARDLVEAEQPADIAKAFFTSGSVLSEAGSVSSIAASSTTGDGPTRTPDPSPNPEPETGASPALTCLDDSEYCVPYDGFGDLAADAIPVAFANNETGSDSGETGDEAGNVVRGYVLTTVVDDFGHAATAATPFLGNRDAPIQFAVISNFACSHCNGYHTGDLHRFITDYVLTGQAGLRYILMVTTGGGDNARRAGMAAICAGEQGAFWEMTDELFLLARTQGMIAGFSMLQLSGAAAEMGLDGDALAACIESGAYEEAVATDHLQLGRLMGATGTPSIASKTADMDTWVIVSRDYETMEALTLAANGQ